MIPKNKASNAKERATVGVEVWGLWVGEVGHPPQWFGPVTPLAAGIFRTAFREKPRDRDVAVILQDMENPFLEAYLHFLSFVLTYMNEFNGMLQARDPLIHKVSNASQKLLRKFCQNFISPEHLGSSEISNPRNFVSTWFMNCNFVRLQQVHLWRSFILFFSAANRRNLSRPRLYQVFEKYAKCDSIHWGRAREEEI